MMYMSEILEWNPQVDPFNSYIYYVKLVYHRADSYYEYWLNSVP